MRIAVVGAGAIGCTVAGRLAAAGQDVTLVARAAQAAAIRFGGLRITGIRPCATPIRMTENADGAGAFDLVVSAVKAHDIHTIADDVAALMGPSGLWMPIINGIPWWYGSGAAGLLADVELADVDPGGAIRRRFDPARIIGAVAILRCEMTAPGVVDFSGGRGLDIGAIAGAVDLTAFATLWNDAGVGARATGEIRSAVWNKLRGNANLNPLSVVTGLTVTGMLAVPEHRATILAVVRETDAIMRASGFTPDSEAEARVAAMEQLGDFRSSMLQDADAGKPLEIDAIIGAPLEIAARLGIDVPVMRRLDADVRRIALARGLLPRS